MSGGHSHSALRVGSEQFTWDSFVPMGSMRIGEIELSRGVHEGHSPKVQLRA